MNVKMPCWSFSLLLLAFVTLFSLSDGAYIHSDAELLQEPHQRHSGDINIRRGIERFNDHRLFQNDLDFLHI
ncbi:hypothetical protein GPALN_006201 [Globodera pallida]|uniref:Secreted protein n=1 Tax=Globodera pallida TaxID=36090 RepID=A0A183BL77_GLOPA|nr:hypothetical protein GPALN_006201 [Globodera pallida]